MVATAQTPAEKSINKTEGSDVPDGAPVQRVIHPGGTVPQRPVAPRKLSIQEILDKGKVIVLTDGTAWRVANDDADYTSGWLGPATVRVKKKKRDDGTYMYFMTNTWTNKTVEVSPIK